MRKLLILLFLLPGITPAVIAQTDPWTGTWRAENKPNGGRVPIVMELRIGAPAQGVLFPAQIKLQYGKFSGTYEVLLAKKTDTQLGLGRGKYPIEQSPFKLGIWMLYLNGTLDYKNGELSLHRMWIDKADIFMRGLYDDDEIWVSTKVELRDFLYRQAIIFRKVNNTPWTHPDTRRIIDPDPEKDSVYFGLYQRISSNSKTVELQVEDQEKYDRDTVTLLHNGRVIFSRTEINDGNRRQIVELDSGRNIFTIFADNYGGLPPNTGRLLMKIDGEDYRFNFTARPNVYATFLAGDIYYTPSPGKDLTSRASERTTTPLATLEVDTADITLELWDGQVEDGDSISLRLNGQWIATGFPVKNKLQKIPVKLRAGENSLLFMADNLGSIPPNTSELRIRNGTKTKTVGLNTDFKKNNEIKLILKE